MVTKLDIRRTTTADTLSAVRFFRKTVRSLHFYCPQKRDHITYSLDEQSLRQKLKAGGCQSFLGSDNRGATQAMIHGTSTNYGTAIQISWILVAPPYRQQQVAQALFDRLLGAAKDAKTKFMYAAIHPENAPSLSFFKKNGFAFMRPEFFDGEFDALFERPLVERPPEKPEPNVLFF